MKKSEFVILCLKLLGIYFFVIGFIAQYDETFKNLKASDKDIE